LELEKKIIIINKIHAIINMTNMPSELEDSLVANYYPTQKDDNSYDYTNFNNPLSYDTVFENVILAMLSKTKCKDTYSLLLLTSKKVDLGNASYVERLLKALHSSKEESLKGWKFAELNLSLVSQVVRLDSKGIDLDYKFKYLTELSLLADTQKEAGGLQVQIFDKTLRKMISARLKKSEKIMKEEKSIEIKSSGCSLQ